MSEPNYQVYVQSFEDVPALNEFLGQFARGEMTPMRIESAKPYKWSCEELQVYFLATPRAIDAKQLNIERIESDNNE